MRAEMSSRLEVQPRTCFDKRAKTTCIEEKEDIYSLGIVLQEGEKGKLCIFGGSVDDKKKEKQNCGSQHLLNCLRLSWKQRHVIKGHSEEGKKPTSTAHKA